MKYTWFILIYLAAWQARGQALQDINYNYLYNSNEKFSIQIKPIHSGDEWFVLVHLRLKDKSNPIENYSIQLEKRDALNDKQGAILDDSLLNLSVSKTNETMLKTVSFTKEQAPKILVAKVVDNLAKKAWIFYDFLLPEYPVNSHLVNEDAKPRIESFVISGSTYSIKNFNDNQQPWVTSYYTDAFPAGAPPFSEGQARVPSVIKADSTIIIPADQPTTFTAEGLYLVQKDTTSKNGFSFRVYNDYPKFAKIENLVDPLIYVCTKQEIERLREARGDKKSFDRVILSITGNTDRAKNFMRNYFQRVEQANQYFASYKEGWKTDRGMIYIIFGLPDELFKFTDREVWTYKNDLYKITFDFVRSPTLFDPDNYVLIRNKKYQDTWYQVIDFWRNARF